ncbi:hypothetical protein [Marinobacter fonticola]|uniref:hypothetical protein n=1 Tax=Marinobacter fonticola TaxID=2603215 RepID=UPI0011E74407|nr:hypothetical protein [Marinobacter fonticola]
MERMKSLARYVLGPISSYGIIAALPDGKLRGLMGVYWHEYVKTWVFRGFLGLLIGYGCSLLLSNQYYLEAAKQMMAPLFWNIVVVIGLFFALFGILAHIIKVTPLSAYFMKSSRAIMSFASQVGALGFGAVLGLLCVAALQSGMNEFFDYLKSFVGVAFLIIMFILNLIVWWVAYCLRDDTPQPDYFVYVGEHKGLLFIMCLLMIVLLMMTSALAGLGA